MVALIALIPAVIILVVSFWTDSKGWTLFSAILMAALGALTGNPIYAVLDVLIVYGAYALANHLLKDRLEQKDRDLQRRERAKWVAEMEEPAKGPAAAAMMVAADKAAVIRRLELMQRLEELRAEAAKRKN